MIQKSALLLVLSLLFGAASASSQVWMFNKTEFAPTAFHRTIYEMMENCSGVDGDLENVRWFVSQLILVGDPNVGHQWVGAFTNAFGGPEIILQREYAFDGKTVSHEVLHELFVGDAPMDIASRCVLDWDRLTFLPFREEKEEEEER